MLDAQAVRRAFRARRVRVDAGEAAAFAAYLQLLERWNRAVSLTSIGEAETRLLRHCIEPVLARPYLVGAGPRVLDAGSGAGAPGLALKIVDPEREYTLVEANGRKASFLREAVETLGLAGVEVVEGRIEELVAGGGLEGPFHVLTSRAWTSGWGPLLGVASRVMERGGRALLFVGEETLRSFRRHLWTGTALPEPGGRDWREAAEAGWQVRQALPIPHLNHGYIVRLQLPS